jgi:protein-tyrosine-phosphatase
MAEILLREVLERRGVDGVTVASAGTGAWDGAPVSEGAYLIALEHGLDLSAHRARLLTREMTQDADPILTMSRHHRARVNDLGGAEKVFVLGEYAGRIGESAEVRDPFGGDLGSYRQTYDDLAELTDAAKGRIAWCGSDRVIGGSTRVSPSSAIPSSTRYPPRCTTRRSERWASMPPTSRSAAMLPTSRDLVSALAKAGGGGNVTIPHKETAAKAITRPSDRVQRLGACNTFWGDDTTVVGDNTDVAA